ncbi:MAG: NUDIX domain-containing protein [Cyanobacteria bacterium CRU_2_1]|nr:NUDIX domain-containing protein [Cyanobacteria bacterium CRU_2_1]
MMQDEWLDIVDENDRVVGQQWRSEVYRQGLPNFRVINAFVVNAQGQLWIPRRTAHKRIFPNGLDFSVAGHVEHGEGYDEAFARELKEELNWDLAAVSYCQLGYLSPYTDDVPAFMTVYEIQSDETPAYNSNDFSDSSWFSPSALLEQLIRETHPAKPSLAKLVQRFYLKY